MKLLCELAEAYLSGQDMSDDIQWVVDARTN